MRSSIRPAFVGIDFDNTIVRYDRLFHQACVDKRLIPATVPANKSDVRDHLRRNGQEDLWTEMQGEVYGSRMAEADAFPGVLDFFRACTRLGVRLAIVSHKTRYPYVGPRYDIHAAAYGWLEMQGLFDEADIGLRRDAVFFELSKGEKLARIGSIGCDTFIDDLPEILSDASFPAGVDPILFDPADAAPPDLPYRRITSWPQLTEQFFGRPDA